MRYVGASFGSPAESQPDGVRAHGFRFTIREYGARSHAAGKVRFAEYENTSTVRFSVRGKSDDVDPARSSFIDSILARLREEKEPEVSRRAAA